MNIQDFLTNEKIPYLQFYYFIKKREDGTIKKQPIKEKNDLSIEEIEIEKKNRLSIANNKPSSYWIKEGDKYNEYVLTSEEKKSLVLAYTNYIKHTSYYCIDIDEEIIYTMNDYIQFLQKNNVKKSIIDILNECPWTIGNTKGIHIYIKLDNVPDYTQQLDVFHYLLGDFIKTNNMWERINKTINNYNKNNKTIIFNFNDIKDLFKSDQLNPKPEEKKTKKTKKTTTQEEKKTTTQEETNIINNEVKDYLNIMLDNKAFDKLTGYKNWLDIGILLKNTYADNGFTLFNLISEAMPKYDGEEETKRFYNDLNKKIFNSDKKLSLGTIKKSLKDLDKVLYDTINIKYSSLKKGNNNSTYTFDKQYMDKFNTSYFKQLEKYNEKKAYFEFFCCKVLRPEPLYMYNEIDNEQFNSLMYCEKKMIETFKHLGSGIFKIDKTGDKKETKFINEWLNDDNLKLYNNMEFMPYNGCRLQQDNNNNKTCYNLFNGYNNDILTEYDKNNNKAILKPFKDLLYELVGADQSYVDYFYNFLAHLIQKPNERIPISFIFKSLEGSGKNMMLDTIGDIIGRAHYITSSRPKDFFGEYAEGFYRKLLVNINETEATGTFDYEGVIKSFITENTITLNPKFVRQTTINNYARLIITTNKPNPIKIDVKSKDRRFVVYQSTNKYLDNQYGTTFWTKLKAHFKNPKFISCLYDDLNNINLELVKWKEERPITKAYLEMCKQYIPVEALFLEYYIDNKLYNELNTTKYNKDNRNNEISINTIDFYNYYVSYCQLNGFINDKQFQINITKFNTRLSELDVQILKVKTSSTSVFRFTPKTVYDILIDKKWISKDNNDINDDDINKLKNIGGDNFDDYFVEL